MAQINIETFEDKKAAILGAIGIGNLDELSEIEIIDNLSIIKSLIKVNSLIAEERQNDIYNIIKTSGALLRGHFLLLSEKHSEYFIRFSKISRNPKNLELISQSIIDEIRKNGLEFNTILSPETAGSALAVTISKILMEKYQKKVQTIYAKTDDCKKPTSLINWVDLKPNDKVLLVNDMISTGTGMRELNRLTGKYGGSVSGICVFTYRSDLDLIETLKQEISSFFFSLTDSSKLDQYTYDQGISCAICQASGKKPVPSKYLN